MKIIKNFFEIYSIILVFFFLFFFFLQITTISGANITSADNTATNGIIHVIDRVLYRFPEASTPQLVDEHVNLTTMALLIDKGGLHDVLKGEE